MIETHNLPAPYLHALARRLFTAAGAPRATADDVAGILVNSNLAGHDSHGVLRVPAYLRMIEVGTLQPAAEPQVVKEAPNLLVIDGQSGFGHLTAKRAMSQAIDKARRENVCCVTFTQVGHVGRLGEYAEMAAHAGCLGMVMVGSGSRRNANRVVAYGGGAGAGVLGTNPLAIGAPTGDDTPFVLDYATSVMAEGKIQVARSKGLPMPEGVILDHQGNPTTNPHDFYEGGYLLPFAKHKGFALSLTMCLFGGLAGNFDLENQGMGGAYMQVVNIAAFTPLEQYQLHVRSFLDGIKSLSPAPGVDEIIVPGDFEARNRRQRLAEGVPLPTTIHDQLNECAAKLSVPTGQEIVEASDLTRYQ
ncbi:MAG: dehydrogenase [Chloroflexi bacterium]|nr:MAG: dehydrogenase [Chloroflexota bacterium]